MHLTRRDLLACSLGLATNLSAELAYRDYSRCLPDYLRGLARRAYETRNAALAKLTTPAAIRAHQHWVRETFWTLAGGQPERTPLEARTLDTFERPGYRVEKIVYQSQLRVFVPANLYIPTSGAAPFPGILFQMGHSPNGKAWPEYQKCCQGLARLGYVVLAFDPMGQGERTYYPGPNGLTRLQSSDEEHTRPGKQMLLLGDTASRMQLWDAVRSLDYLASRPEIDPQRLASTGQSGGATITMLLAAVDDRLASVALASANTENFACAGFDPPGSTDDAEQDLIGSGEAAFDRWDLLYPLAPKPLLVMVSAKDFFETYSPHYLASGLEEFQKLRKVYGTLGHADRLEWAETPLPHGLAYDSRLRIYNWFERTLKGSARTIEREPTVEPEPDRVIWVGATGNVVQDFQSLRPIDLIIKRAAAAKPGALDQNGLSKLLGIGSVPAHAQASVLSRVPSTRYSIEAIEVPSAPNVWVPAWVFTPPKATPGRATILLLDELGRSQHWREGALGDKIASAGRILCAADVRGIGDLRPEAGRGFPGYTISHAHEEEYAWASLILGHSLLGQRVIDILALVEAFSPNGPVSLAANGRLTVPALCAAALSPRVASVLLVGGLASLRNVAETEMYECPLANIVPGWLLRTDLPDLTGAISPRRVHLAGSLDAAGNPLSTDAVRRVYPYSSVQISEESGWQLETLLDL
jgi:dienelactone hydrolase